MTKLYSFDFESKSIVILSSTFAKKASTPGTKESATLVDLMTKFPGFSIVKGYTEKTRSNKYKNISYPNMRAHIVAVSESEEAAEKALKELERQIQMAKIQKNPFMAVRDWFLEQYPEVRPEEDKTESEE